MQILDAGDEAALAAAVAARKPVRYFCPIWRKPWMTFNADTYAHDIKVFADDVRQHFPNQVLNAVIPRSVRVSEAPSYQQPVITYDKSSPGTIAYLEAAIELANRGA